MEHVEQNSYQNTEPKEMDHSRIIIGCGNFGGIGSLPHLIGKGDDEITADVVLRAALRRGIFRFDTANSYGGGQSEEILGRFIHGLPASLRLRLEIATKIGNPHGRIGSLERLTRLEMQHQVERSLRRLHIDCIDLLYIHEVPSLVGIDEIILGLKQLVGSGKIKKFGFSNVTFGQFKIIFALLDREGRDSLGAVQNEFHLLRPDDSAQLIPFLVSKNIRYVAYSPLAGGLLTGKYSLGQKPPLKSRLDLRPQPYELLMSPRHFQLIQRHTQNCLFQNISPAAGALRYVLSSFGISAAIIGPRKTEHYESLGLKLQ